MEYPLDHEEVERLKRYFQSRGEKAELVWMTPDEFLARVPHIATTMISQLTDLRSKWFEETSLGSIRKAFIQKMKLPPLILDYTRMWFGWPTHEGRHRAYVAKMYGIDKVPVLIVGEAKFGVSYLGSKCRFWKVCELYREDSYTCNNEFDASRYCGKYRELAQKYSF